MISFIINIVNKFFDYKIYFVNSQHGNTNQPMGKRGIYP